MVQDCLYFGSPKLSIYILLIFESGIVICNVGLLYCACCYMTYLKGVLPKCRLESTLAVLVKCKCQYW